MNSDFHMADQSKKACSICGRTFPAKEFSYGNKDNRSYCQACDKAEKSSYSAGGTEAARTFREEQRAKWLSESRSRRTASPPLSSSVRWHVRLLSKFTRCSIAPLLLLGISACNSVPRIDGSSDAAFDRSHAQLVESISPQDRMRLSLAEAIVLTPLGCATLKPIPGQPFLTKILGSQSNITSCRKELNGLSFKDIMSRAYPK